MIKRTIMNYNFQRMKKDVKTTSIMLDVYIALAVLPDVFRYDQSSIESKVDIIINNLIINSKNLKKDVTA